MSATPTDLAPALSAQAGDGCRGNAGGHESAARVGADGHERGRYLRRQRRDPSTWRFG